MSKLEWKESWSVGYNLLNEDHMVLIDIINRVKASQENNKPIDWVLQDLSDYVDLHFSREEEMMHIVGYSGFDEHVKEHRSFVEWLYTVKFSFNNNIFVDIKKFKYSNSNSFEISDVKLNILKGENKHTRRSQNNN